MAATISSSSTKSSVAGPSRLFEEGGAAARAGAGAEAGRKTRNVVPRPLPLRTVRNPWWFCTIPKTEESPNPVALPVFLVVKNGSKIRACVWASMPIPGSATVMHT